MPNKINVETLRVDINRKDIAQLKDSLKYTKSMIQDQVSVLGGWRGGCITVREGGVMGGLLLMELIA